MKNPINIICLLILIFISFSFGLTLLKDDCRTSMYENTFSSTTPPLHNHRYAISPTGNWVLESIQYEKNVGSDWCDSVQLYLFKYCFPSEHIYLTTVYAGISSGVMLTFMADGFGGISQGGSWRTKEDTVYLMVEGSTINAIDKKDTAEIFKMDVSSITSGITNAFKLGSASKLIKTSNYPNPFAKMTIIEYSVLKDEFVAINIYNSKGELIRVLGQEKQLQGKYHKTWDGKDNQGH
jgi:hypothetical protein